MIFDDIFLCQPNLNFIFKLSFQVKYCEQGSIHYLVNISLQVSVLAMVTRDKSHKSKACVVGGIGR